MDSMNQRLWMLVFLRICQLYLENMQAANLWSMGMGILPKCSYRVQRGYAYAGVRPGTYLLSFPKKNIYRVWPGICWGTAQGMVAPTILFSFSQTRPPTMDSSPPTFPHCTSATTWPNSSSATQQQWQWPTNSSSIDPSNNSGQQLHGWQRRRSPLEVTGDKSFSLASIVINLTTFALSLFFLAQGLLYLCIWGIERQWSVGSGNGELRSVLQNDDR